MSARAVPFYCPYCGEEDLVPEPAPGGAGEGHGHWACRACRRAFRLSLTALAVVPETGPAPVERRSAEHGEDGGGGGAGVLKGNTGRHTGSANGTVAAPSDVEETD